ncbi:error-prone DNA polymerase [Pseudobacteriovorax antillogorgiicola]|uniref:Error-prone DNA polymerase n=1 Tax=Pseudobacteriovorax antillogorgiicola TaxID=1513793 RepID=A0A1Y6CS98_9BACT|nr:error-prone DNA polymerase [Pseudobacteriovorax antillogorgiicola]TCS45636.1 DnaE-like error-prone DNA polymerase [Pseudobacteriovorax antillogorgiicola]SMF72683.1 error-prone DNA polymerase, DnaE-like [Pseudobacteriovorax antillogorgiicola]
MAYSLKNIPWVEWICHSNFSFLTGASHPEDYILRASELSYRGIGICDYDGLYGVVRAHRQWETMGKPLKLIIGAEVHLAPHHKLPITLRDSLVLKASSYEGYQNLCVILSRVHHQSKTEGFITLDDLASMPVVDLVCIQPMRGIIRREGVPAAREHYYKLKEIFGQRLSLTVSRHLNPAEDRWIEPTLALGQSLEIPILMSQDAFFHRPQEKDLCDVVQAIRLNKTVAESVPHMFANDERSLHNLNELHARYHELPCFHDALAHSLDLLDSFQFDLRELKYSYPQEMIPDGFTSQSYLEHLVWEAFETYASCKDHLRDVIRKELQLIRILEFADYFLTVWDIVQWARKKNILCQGRGSAANSTVCFMLGITSVDPSLFELLFERFLSLERGDPPDIDVDFEHERREEVIQYIYERYGRPRAAMVANVITFRSRGAIRSVGKALGISEHTLSAAAKSQEDIHSYRKSPGQRLEKLQQEEGRDIPWQLWSNLSERLKGFPRHMGLHSGGFIISQHPLDSIVPQEPATMEGRTVVQWAKDDIEYLNLFKIDVLALGMLTVLKRCIEMAKSHYQRNLSLAEIPQGDEETYAMIQRAETVGTFQIESRAQMSMLPRLRPKTFYDLVVQIGIIRPGPIQGGLIHPFLRRRDGLEEVIYPHPKLKPILERTQGVPIFQEQVMRVAMAVGNFSPGEADQLRKQIGSWSINKNMGPLIQKLEQGMRQNGIKEIFVQQIIGHLRGFADYGFPESHAASFALLAYASSYFKCHLREVFYTSLINSQPMGFYSVHALLQSARREGSIIRPISLNQSQWLSTLEHIEGDQFAIRLGFHLVRGLSKNGGQALLQLREKHGTWSDLYKYLQQNPLNRSDLTALVAADSFADLGIPRAEALWIAEAAPFADLVEEDLQARLPKEDAFSKIEKDFEAFSTSLGEHPSSLIRRQYWNYAIPIHDLTLAQDLKSLIPNQTVYVFGMVLVRQSPLTAKGMIFFTLEDETGFINLAFTPPISKQYSEIINRQGFICISGKLQSVQEGHSILVRKVYPAHSSPKVIDLKKLRAIHNTEDSPASRKTLQRARNYM